MSLGLAMRRASAIGRGASNARANSRLSVARAAASAICPSDAWAAAAPARHSAKAGVDVSAGCQQVPTIQEVSECFSWSALCEPQRAPSHEHEIVDQRVPGPFPSKVVVVQDFGRGGDRAAFDQSVDKHGRGK